MMKGDFNVYFRQDLLQLFNNYYQEKSFRYSDFVQCWSNLKFYQIFSVQRFFPIEYRFVEFLYDEDLYPQVRTAALYTLYGLYANQINRPKLKIPVTPKQWIQILKFINEISQAEHVDVEHSFRYLVHSDGFEFCSSFELENENCGLKTVGNSSSKNSKTGASNNTAVQIMTSSEFNEAVFNDEINEQIGTIHEAYLQCKDDINKSGSCKLSSFVNADFKTVIGEDILKKLDVKTTTKFEKHQASKQVVDDDDQEDENDSSTELDDNQPTTSKEAAKRSRRGAKAKYNKNFPGMMLDADESDDDDEE